MYFNMRDEDEEPEHGESVYGDVKELPSISLEEELSASSAIRPNY